MGRSAFLLLSQVLVATMTLVAALGAHALPVSSPAPAAPVACAVVPQDPETLCEATWRQSALQKLKRDPGKKLEYDQRVEKLSGRAADDLIWEYERRPTGVCKAYVAGLYTPQLAVPLNALRTAVDRQKDTIERRWSAAKGDASQWLWGTVVMGALIAFVAALVGTFTATSTPPATPTQLLILKIANIGLPTILTAVTALGAFYDTRNILAAESRASVAISELQSQIEDAALIGCLPTSSDPRVLEPLTAASISAWNARLSAILRTDSDAYIKRYEASSSK